MSTRRPSPSSQYPKGKHHNFRRETEILPPRKKSLLAPRHPTSKPTVRRPTEPDPDLLGCHPQLQSDYSIPPLSLRLYFSGSTILRKRTILLYHRFQKKKGTETAADLLPFFNSPECSSPKYSSPEYSFTEYSFTEPSSAAPSHFVLDRPPRLLPTIHSFSYALTRQ